MTNVNVNIAKGGGEIVPEIHCFSTNKIVLKERQDFEIETSFL